jgi:hypothetical protein
MSVIAILQLIFLVISNIPNLITVVTDIIKLIQSLHPAQQPAAFALLKAAIENHNQAKALADLKTSLTVPPAAPGT